MSRTGPTHRNDADVWKYALLGGLFSLPFTLASYAQTRSELSLSAVLLGGFLAGYLATRRTGSSAGVGIRAGLVGALPTLWMLFDMRRVVRGISNPPWFSIALVGLGLVVTVLGFGLGALGGEVGARFGSWVARTTD